MRLISLLTLCQLATNPVLAFEALEPAPGTRAMGMAGAFAPQADDSSAIWYNPAGPKHSSGLRQEVSVEFAATPTGTVQLPDGVNPAAGFGETQKTLRFVGGYRAGVNPDDDQSLGIGLAYLRLYDGTSYVDAPRSLLDTTPFGRVEATYHQVSGSLSRQFSPRLTFGASLDALWTEIQCLDFSPCVDNGPSGFGGSLGLLYDLAKTEDRAVTVSATWRSRANLAYDAIPASGVGTVLEQYLPDRPQTLSLGLGAQRSLLWAHLRGNLVYEMRDWSGATSTAAPLSDYAGWAAGAELLFAHESGGTIALRGGLRRMSADGAGDDVNGISAGAGYGFAGRHALDIAFERREGGGPQKQEATAWSISYSIQF